ncbi:hypothetical protein EW026_g6087 [Hermanssonia centrifuga]|uniref:DUF6532 domain-containing protein n=1 Tax=Hermanssonia centrifuga TaxID=98765 RepID=A0A4S4KC34_9APHY|nr:hypothetical protein EW026_g6087 [Hermanssonia centrifuga]
MGEHDADVVANKDWIEGYEDTGKVIPDVFKVLRVMTDNEIAQIKERKSQHRGIVKGATVELVPMEYGFRQCTSDEPEAINFNAALVTKLKDNSAFLYEDPNNTGKSLGLVMAHHFDPSPNNGGVTMMLLASVAAAIENALDEWELGEPPAKRVAFTEAKYSKIFRKYLTDLRAAAQCMLFNFLTAWFTKY